MTALRILTVLIVTTGSLHVRADEESLAVPKRRIDDACRDILFYHPDAPVFLRVHIEVDGKPFDQPWNEWLGNVFSELDTDGNARLTADELTSGPAERSLDARRLAADPGLWSADRLPWDQAITIQELSSYLIVRKRGPLQAPDNTTAPLNRSQAGERLFQLLDRDADDALSRSECLLAMRTLRRRDLDDDGSISLGELSTVQGMNTRANQPSVAPSEVRFDTLVGKSAPLSVLKELERRYGSYPGALDDRDATVRPELGHQELGFSSDALKRWDRDSDGRLNRTELRQMVRTPPPTLELRVRLGTRQLTQPGIEALGAPANSKVQLRRAQNGMVSIVYQNLQVELVEVSRDSGAAWQYLVNRFSAGDRDRNGYIDMEEARQSDAFQNSFAQFDDDSDGKLFQEEVHSVFESHAAAARCRIHVSIRDCGRDLMEILNADRNQSLTEHELAAAAERVELWDTDGNSVISSYEIPQLYQITFGPGKPQIPGVQFPGQSVTMPAGPSASASGATGPVWFGKLDRNSDGELSRREFPGSRTEYQALDRNSDGRVTAGEAEFAQ